MATNRLQNKTQKKNMFDGHDAKKRREEGDIAWLS